MMKNIFSFIFLSVLLPSLFIACSKGDDNMLLTVNTPIPVKPSLPVNLTDNLMSLMSITLGVSCYQNEMYLVVYDPQADAIIDSKHLKMKSNYNPAIVPAITYSNGNIDVGYAINALTSYSSFDEPANIIVPKNRPIEVALIGTFYNPADNDNNGICDAISGVTAISSSQLFGHSVVTNGNFQSGSVSLKVDVMHTNPGTAYTLTGYGQRYRDWVQTDASFSYSSNYGRLKTVKALNDQLIIKVDNNSASKYYLPHIFPLTLEFDYTGTSTGCSVPGSCSGSYRVVVNGNGSSVNPTLYSTLSGTPFSTFPSAPVFQIDTY